MYLEGRGEGWGQTWWHFITYLLFQLGAVLRRIRRRTHVCLLVGCQEGLPGRSLADGKDLDRKRLGVGNNLVERRDESV